MSRAAAPGRIRPGGMDGSTAGAGRRARCHAKGHAPPTRRARSASRSGGSGSAAAREGSDSADSHARAAPARRRTSAPNDVRGYRPRNRPRCFSAAPDPRSPMRSNRVPNARKSASASPTANASGATTRTTTSSPVSASVEVLNASLINRLALFLSTARRSTLLPTTSPKRGLAAALRWAMTASGGAERRMFGRLNTASKSRRWRSRSSRPKRRGLPAAAAHRLRRGPSGASSGIGMRRTPERNAEQKGEDAPNGPGGQPLHR